MKLQVIKNRVFHWVKNIVLYGLYSLVILMVTSFFVLQIPAVQSALTSRFLRSFSDIVDFKTTIERVEFYWFDRVVLKNIRVYDPEDNEMLGIDRVIVNFKFSYFYKDNNINLDGATLENVRVDFRTIQETDTSRNLNINLFVKRINELNERTGKESGQMIKIGEAIIRNARFSFQNDREAVQSRFDPNHFSLVLPETELQNFLILGDTIEFNVRSLTAHEEKFNFSINELTTFFRISQLAMEFQGLKLKAGNSFITDTLIFSYTSQQALSSFIDSVTIHAHLQNAKVDPRDLSIFAPLPEGLKTTLLVSGDFNGRVNKFRFTGMDIRMGDTELQGSLEMDGLPDINETFILLSLRKSQINFNDLGFLFNDNTKKRLAPLGRLGFKGQFLGYPTDFVATGDFSSRLGRIVSDINLKIDERNIENSEYNGQLTLTNFDLGRYLGDTLNFQKVNMSGKVNGKGLTLQSANFGLNGSVQSIGIKGYDYKNITTNARFASQFFNGTIGINDPNLEFQATGSIDLRNNLNRISIQGSLDTAYLHRLNLSTKEVFIHTKLDIDMRGLELDSLQGNAILNDVYAVYDGNAFQLDHFTFYAKKQNGDRSLSLESSLLDAEAKGNFYFSKLFQDLPRLIREFRLNIENNPEVLNSYYQQQRKEPDRYAVSFLFNLKDVSPIASLFGVDLELSRQSVIQGKFNSGPTTILQGYAMIDTIRLNNDYFYTTDIEINASKISDSTSVLAMAYAHSRSQEIAKVKTKDLITEVIWNNNLMDVEMSISQQKTTNRFDLSSSIEFKDVTAITLNPSTIRVLEKNWRVNDNNLITIKGKEWSFRNVGFSQSGQSINMNGFLSQDSTRELKLKIQNFELANINPLITKTLRGKLDSEVTLNNYFGEQSIQNSVNISNLSVDDFLIGNITGNNLWDTEINRFNIEFFIDRAESRIVNCKGFYDPNDKDDPLQVTARFSKANLKIFEPFIDEVFSQFQGTLSGVYQITGTLARPELNGEGRLENGAMQVNYLKTMYQFTGILGLTPTSIYFKDIDLTDAFRNKARLNGAITHANFYDMQISMNAQFSDFQLLNTSAKDNSLFYGQGYGTGSVNFSGPLNNLVITATATTRKNTRIYIPISGTSTIEQKDYISFVTFNDSTAQQAQQRIESKKVNLTGVTMDFNLDITPDAYCEIIFDLKAGDIIRGRGNGKLKLQLDTKGEMNMFGPIEFTEGWYNFTLYDIINKEFQILPGSNITWFGDPYQGTLRIDATYNQLASLAPIISDQSLANVPQVRRKYPVQVLLKLDGPMLSPTINFDIVAKDLPKSISVEGRPPVALDLEFTAFKSRIDEQELKRQVFSLIVLRRFTDPQSFDTSGSLVNSVSELFSNQLSYWLSQVDENLEIDVNLGSMDQEAFNAFQLRMSYTFLNGRLRVTRDGVVGNQNPAATTTDNRNELASAIGDWTVDYLLSADGKFRVKMYSRNNVNPLVNNINSQNAITTGVSLMHTQSFNEFKDLLRASRDKNRQPLPTEEELNDEALKEEDGSN